MMADTPYRDPGVAAAYARLAVPAQFARPAHDLVELLDPPVGGRVLDVGTGTGVVARELSRAVGVTGLVIGIDASAAMARAGSEGQRLPPLIALAPGLPIRDGSMDAVAAGFVVSHIEDYRAGLADMRRVCKVRGRVGITAWGTMPNPAGALWKHVASAFAASERLADAFRQAIPWDEWFSNAANVEGALRDAGLGDIQVVTREFVIRLPTTDFIAMKGATVEGTLLRRMLGADEWHRFIRQTTDAFQQRFGDVVAYVRDFHVGVATRDR